MTFSLKLAAIAVAGCLAMAQAAQASTIISSDWNISGDLDGWTRNYPSSLLGAGRGDAGSRLAWSSANGGSLLLADVAAGNGDWFVAPTKFLGDWSNGGTLSFDYYSSFATTTNMLLDLVSGSTSKYGPAVTIAAGWNHFVFDLSTLNINLANITGLGIYADLRAGTETEYLDNFTLSLNASPQDPSGTPVPEPTSCLILAASLAGLFWFHHKQQRAKGING